MSFSPALPPLSASEVEALVTAVADYRASMPVWFASLTILLYDHLLTLPQEVAYLRACQFRRIRVLFVVNRYWPILHLLIDIIALTVVGAPEAFCSFFFNWLCYASTPIHITIGTILIQRLYAMFNRNRTLLVLLSAALIAQLIAEALLLGPIVAKMKPVGLPPPFPTCFAANPNTRVWLYWLPMMAFEGILFTCAITKVYRVARDETRAPRILAVLLRDSVAYFGGMLTIILANLIIWAAARPSLVSVAIGPALAAPSILGCRMLLNIHAAVQPSHSGHASIFAASFIKPERQIMLRPMHRRGALESSISFEENLSGTTAHHERA